MSEQHVIERLPEETRSKLRSTQILTSLPQIVVEFLKNSLDAEATQIVVGIDLKEWMCWVRDDGHGISKEGLEKFGQGEGGRYHSSKVYAPGFSASTFGFRGEALASAADISCLEICSRTDKSRNTWSVIVKGNQRLYLGSAVRWTRTSHGTTVCVRDAFYNLPIRRRSHPTSSRTWELVRREIEIYALMFPGVSFALEDASLHTEGSQSKERMFRIPKTTSTLDAFRHLFGRAMTEHIEEIDFASDAIRIIGFISLSGSASKAYQFLYINRHPVSIHDYGRAIDLEIAASSFSNTALNDIKDLPRSTIRRSPRKNEKKPVYVLNVTIKSAEQDNWLEPSKNSADLGNRTDVVSCLRTIFRSFLEKHNFRTANRDSNNSSPVPSMRRKSGVNDTRYVEEVSITGKSGLALEERPIPKSVELYASTNGSPEILIWQDPTTDARFKIDSRTGHSYPYTEGWTTDADTVDSDLNSVTGRRTLRKISASSEPNSELPKWLEDALQENRTYAVPEDKIQSVKLALAPSQFASNWDNYDGGHEFVNSSISRDDLRRASIINQIDCKFIACRIPERICDSLETPLGQLSKHEGAVILIDQHAADERIRVERFLKELCIGFLRSPSGTKNDHKQGVRTKALTPPIPVLLTHRDTSTLVQSQDAQEFLRKWGIQIGFSPSLPISDPAWRSERSTYSQILVNTVPEVIGDKLLQRDELRDLIQGFVAQLESSELVLDSHLDFQTDFQGDDEFAWLKAVRYCPRGLLELINSKACRGAIMFNDPLSVEQCEKLVRNLSETAFPFQCAHGRPSLVPVADTRVLFQGRVPRQIPQDNWIRITSK